MNSLRHPITHQSDITSDEVLACPTQTNKFRRPQVLTRDEKAQVPRGGLTSEGLQPTLFLLPLEPFDDGLPVFVSDVRFVRPPGSEVVDIFRMLRTLLSIQVRHIDMVVELHLVIELDPLEQLVFFLVDLVHLLIICGEFARKVIAAGNQSFCRPVLAGCKTLSYQLTVIVHPRTPNLQRRSKRVHGLDAFLPLPV